MRSLWTSMLIGLLAVGTADAHRGTSNRTMWSVCETLDRGDTCSFTDHHRDLHRGTCRSFSGELACVRNQPLIPSPSPFRATLVAWGPGAVVSGVLLLGLGLVGRRTPLFSGGHDDEA